MRVSVERAPETRPAHPAFEGHHTCIRCPVCRTEECAVLQDLGRWCDTVQSVTEALRAERVRWGAVRARNGGRGRLR